MYAGAGPTTATSRAALGGPLPESLGHRRRLRLGGGSVGEADGQLDEPTERRRPEPPPELQLGVVEGGGIVLGDGPDRRMVGLVRLDDREARPLAAAGPARGLGEELVRPLRGPLVGQIERDVGRHDADERDVRDVDALGDEAGPDEDVEPALRRMRRGPARRRPRRSTTSRSSRPTRSAGKRSRTSRSTRSVPPPR